ncbi:hypothetical protein LLG90_11450 [Aromatoleum toluclasticum]|uniref:hypothetical protein n=1 Tax=Aromatoleum toluclasticum TaxID=92003 RepID=UPI001D17FA5D|nr:hypothetical protein [Aromatoleum toluclasticum]MCC4115964.1 hypothetical protein [Aromatoleum toluclasticum]
MMRPDPAIWFEVLAARRDGLRIALALAACGCAEFESASLAPVTAGEGAEEGAEQQRVRSRFEALERRYGNWWPVAAPGVGDAFDAAGLARALARIEGWAACAAQPIEALARAEAELSELARWQHWLAGGKLGFVERRTLAGDGALGAGLYACERGAAVQAPDGVLMRAIEGPDRGIFLALGSRAALAQLDEQVAALEGRRVDVPDWIAVPDVEGELAARRRGCVEAAEAARARLAALEREHGLVQAVAELRRACWGFDCGAFLAGGTALCRVTGWTADPPALSRAIDALGVPALLRFPAPPPGLHAPLLLHNPWWARPYEVFGRLLGMPERDAADPSALVALVFPLLFGYMFGDLGQGMVLTAAGLLAGVRWPLAKMFVPAGLSAAAFGLAFGSAFSLPGLFTPWWLDPLDSPLPVLLLPLMGGAVLLLAGLALAALEARWRGELSAWMLAEGGALVLYLGLLAGVAQPFERWGIPWFGAPAAGAAIALVLAVGRGGGLRAVLAAFATTVEHVVRLVVNTISFVRVGAFAIGHAGLSAALALLAEASGGGWGAVVVVIVGNVLILTLEVLVVAVQTTRLVLFEFFTRFFVGSGRSFRPAVPPAIDTREAVHES